MEKVLKEEQQLDQVLRKKLTSGALKAEQDIAEGRTMTREQMEKRLNVRLGL